MTLESFYAFNNSRVNLKGFSECQNSHFIKQFCFAPNCEPEFMSTLRLLNENHSYRTFLTKRSSTSWWSAMSGRTGIHLRAHKTHVQRQQWWQMSAMPLPKKDCFVFIQHVEPPFEIRSNMTCVLLQLCLRVRGLLPGVIWKFPHCKVTQDYLKYLYMSKQYMGHLFRFSKHLYLTSGSFDLNLNHHPLQIQNSPGTGVGEILLRVSFGLCWVHSEVYEDAPEEHNSTEKRKMLVW